MTTQKMQYLFGRTKKSSYLCHVSDATNSALSQFLRTCGQYVTNLATSHCSYCQFIKVKLKEEDLKSNYLCHVDYKKNATNSALSQFLRTCGQYISPHRFT